jgi:hypothetical protein
VLPPKQKTDRYPWSYFRSKYLASPITHAKQFGKQYERFWTNPRDTHALCRNTDLLIATLVGLSQNIQDNFFDTRPPGNISDEDFDEDVLQLPPSKPEAEPTQKLVLFDKD